MLEEYLHSASLKTHARTYRLIRTYLLVSCVFIEKETMKKKTFKEIEVKSNKNIIHLYFD